MSQFIEMFEDKGYKLAKLSTLIDKSFPGEWGTDDSDGFGVKVIRTTNITNDDKLDLSNVVTRNIIQTKVDKKKLIKGDILLERSGGTNDNPVGRVAYFNAVGTYVVNNFTQTLRCNSQVHSRYLFYFLYLFYKLNKMKVRSMGNQTTGIQNLNMGDYFNISVIIPPMKKQQEYISIVEQADKSKFIGFKSQFIEMMNNTISQRKRIHEIAKVQTGSTPSKNRQEYWLNGNHPWVSAQDMVDKYVEDTIEKVTNAGYATCKIVPSGSVLYVCRGSIGVISINKIDCATNQSICTATCYNDCKNEFLYYSLKYAEKNIKQQGTGTSFKSLNQSSFSAIEIDVPSLDKQNQFIAFAKQADKSKYIN